MAVTATAKKRGQTGKATKAPKEPPPKKRAKRPAGVKSTPAGQTSFLEKVKAANPAITAEQFLKVYQVPDEDAYRMEWFTSLYLYDFNAENAVLKMGYPKEAAKSTGTLFLTHAYCQLKICETLKSIGAEKIVNGTQVIARLWQEANAPDVAFSSNASTRISALGLLTKILGLGVIKKEERQQGPAGGIMFVPIAISQEEWGEYARESQAHLVENAAIDV